MSHKNTADNRAQSERYYGKIRSLKLGEVSSGKHITKRIYQVSSRYVRKGGMSS